MDESELHSLEAFAKEIRVRTIEEIGNLGVGHIGGAMSIVEVLALLYGKWLHVDPARPDWPGRDRFVLSKGHAGPALYAALSIKGFFPVEWLSTLNRGGTRLPSHCDRLKTPGIDMSTGSLGQGIAAACGMATALLMNGSTSRVYCIIGDGESDEGQVWESALYAAHRRLGNLIAFTDKNGLQIDGSTDEVLGLGALEAKWSAFGWFTQRVPGHDLAAMDAAIEKARLESGGRPSMIVLDTVKGKGCSFCEGQVGSHNMSFTMDQARAAVAALG
ncbi:MAG TPA: transketolase [Rectinemataceae bacterium]|nr:transketolase [Rectinemataceae bacterium]